MKNSFDILEEALNAKYHCFTCHTRSSSQIMFTQSCFSIEIYIWNDSVLFLFFSSFIVLKFNLTVLAKLACTSPTQLWKQLQDWLLCHLFTTAIPSLSLPPLCLSNGQNLKTICCQAGTCLLFPFSFQLLALFAPWWEHIIVLSQLHTQPPETQPMRDTTCKTQSTQTGVEVCAY